MANDTLEMRKRKAKAKRDLLQVQERAAQNFQQTFAPGVMELQGLQAGARGIASVLGGPPGRQAPAPEIAPPGFQQLLELPPAVQRAGIATAGAMAAGPLAGAARIPLLAAEPIAAMGGEVLGQVATGTGGLIDILLAGAAPIGLRGLFKAGREGVRLTARNIPGAGATLQEDAIARGRALIRQLRPADLDALQATARSLDNLEVPLQNFQKVAGELQKQAQGLAPRLRPQNALTIVRQVNQMVKAVETRALPLRQVRDNLEEIGAEIGRLRRAVGDRSGLVRGATRNLNALRRTYKAILDDLDDLPGDAPVALQRLRETLRNDFAVSDLETIIEKAITTRQIDGLSSINARQARDAWTKAKDSGFLRDSFTPSQRQAITDFMDEIIRLPALPTPQGIAAGSMNVLTRTAGAGGIIGATMGSEAGAMAAGIAAVTPRIIARALMTPAGRAGLRTMLSQRQILTPQAIQLLAVLSRQAAAPPRPGETVTVPPTRQIPEIRRLRQGRDR